MLSFQLTIILLYIILKLMLSLQPTPNTTNSAEMAHVALRFGYDQRLPKNDASVHHVHGKLPTFCQFIG